MRTLPDARERWGAIFDTHEKTISIQLETTKRDIPSTCNTGLRSICWSLFLLYDTFNPTTWLPALRTSRERYTSLSTTALKLLTDSDALGAPDIDPLAEDESNPWEQYRRDVELRQEIIQDVERCMPDVEFFRDEEVQKRLTEVLFVYCKQNMEVGYRQGFHEIAAVILWVVWNDKIQEGEEMEKEEGQRQDEEVMREVLGREWVNHDAYALFEAVMRNAKAWYELEEGGGMGNSPIVQKSRYIHETLLMVTDPELSEHLKELEVLPQIFLIRWIRLLFSREFPFEDVLLVWDALLAVDKELHLVDLVCVAMLLRIRWRLMGSDYSIALTLLLRYPSPPPPHSPSTFVEDAIYLRNNLSAEGGRHIIEKYSGRAPHPKTDRPKTPSSTHTTSRPTSQRRMLSPPGRLPFPSEPFGALVQDVAKNVLDRGERWGVNRAVRDAVVEVRKNYQKQPNKQVVIQQTPSTREEALEKQNSDLLERLRQEEERRRQLARILELGIGGVEAEGESLQRLLHVKECLLEDSKPLNRDLLHPPAATPSGPLSPGSTTRTRSTSPSPSEHEMHSPPTTRAPVKSRPSRKHASPPGTFVKTSFGNNSDPDFLSGNSKPRMTLAQSSFAWMLGDDPVDRNRMGFVASGKRKSEVGTGGEEGTGGAGGSEGMTRGSEEFRLGDLKKGTQEGK